MLEPTAELQKAAEDVVKDPAVKREIRKFGGPRSLLTRVIAAAAIIGGGATVVACGESVSGDPAAYTIDTPTIKDTIEASKDTIEAFAESFKDVPGTPIVLLSELRAWDPIAAPRRNEHIPPPIWEKGNATFHRSSHHDSSTGSLTILTAEPFIADEPTEQWRGVVLDGETGESLIVWGIRSAAATSLIRPSELTPEDRGLMAMRISINSRFKHGLLDGNKPYTVYLEKVDTERFQPVEGSMRVFNITPPSPQVSR